jgi:signal transduction histidine kinase
MDRTHPKEAVTPDVTLRPVEITEAKRAEQELREMEETRVRNERLAAVSRLAANIGHDIRGPLAALSNALYYVGRRISATELADDKRVTQFLGIIDKELKSCVRIVDDLLDYTRERPLSLVACPLGPLAADAIGVVPALPHIMILNEVPDTLPVPDLDQDQFRQVLVNLIQNAIEAIPRERAGIVQVSASAASEEIFLSISDNGVGIPEEDLDKIFEPLYTTKLKGTGLGLSIVSATISRHGATIHVKTRKDVGTTFTVRLPRREPPAEPPPKTTG